MNSTEPMTTESQTYKGTLKEMQRLCVKSWEENGLPMELTADVNRTFNFRAPTPPKSGPHQTLTDKEEWMDWLTELLELFPLPTEDLEAYRELKQTGAPTEDRQEMATARIYAHLIPPSE